MWKMFDDMIECDECRGILGPPPKFTIPPPPRPPFLGEYIPSKCNEEEMALKAQQIYDADICEAMPILDPSLYNSQSLQTSAIIAVFTLLIVLIVLISSLFVWKNKRKVQNFLPCKTPTRGPHINGSLPLGSNHAMTYEDPDVHLGHHRPLVMRHHQNVEMLHGKSIHFPSGYPMTRSPPFLVSSSPGPDPYRSNDNVYEELGPGRESDGESDPPLHSDDDFAEDELSLPGERFLHKTNDISTLPLPASASITYHDHTPATANGGAISLNGNGLERNSVLSTSSSSTQEASAATATSINSHNNNHSIRNTICASNSSAIPKTSTNIFTGMLRHTTGRSKFHTTSGRSRNKNVDRRNATSIDDFNTSSSTTDTNEIGPLQQMYDNRSNLMSLAYLPHHHQQHQRQQHQMSSNNNMPCSHSYQLPNSNNNNNSNHCNARSPQSQFYNTLENEVERRNRINSQLNNTSAVSTIFRERINYPPGSRYNYSQPYYASNSRNALLANSLRARTVSRSMERRNCPIAPVDQIELAYGYTEPLYAENYHYEACVSPSTQNEQIVHPHISTYPTSYIMPDYTSSGPFRNELSHNHHQQHPTQLYTRGDSSFGSDSGYSHHTPASSIGRQDYDIPLPIPSASPSGNVKDSATSKISAALNFSWHRRKQNSAHSPSASLKVQPTTASFSSSTTDATSPNNNSASSTVTSTLENSSSASSASTSACSNASAASNRNNNTTTIQTQA